MALQHEWIFTTKLVSSQQDSVKRKGGGVVISPSCVKQQKMTENDNLLMLKNQEHIAELQDLDSSWSVLWDIKPVGWLQLWDGNRQQAFEWYFRATYCIDCRLRQSIPIANTVYQRIWNWPINACVMMSLLWFEVCLELFWGYKLRQ